MWQNTQRMRRALCRGVMSCFNSSSLFFSQSDRINLINGMIFLAKVKNHLSIAVYYGASSRNGLSCPFLAVNVMRASRHPFVGKPLLASKPSEPSRASHMNAASAPGEADGTGASSAGQSRAVNWRSAAAEMEWISLRVRVEKFPLAASAVVVQTYHLCTPLWAPLTDTFWEGKKTEKSTGASRFNHAPLERASFLRGELRRP